MSVFVHHGQAKKKSFSDLNHYDIVLTTYGSLAAELKRLETFSLRQRQYPGKNPVYRSGEVDLQDGVASTAVTDSHFLETQPTASERCVLIGPESNWYRVILDEAQCIKVRVLSINPL